jgi:transcriptional regulator with XRE-family HTH domain
MLTAQQIKAARELLGWTPYRLAPRAGMGHTLLRQFESGARPLDPESAARLRAALEEAGVQFPSSGSCTGIRRSQTHAGEFATTQNDQRGQPMSLTPSTRSGLPEDTETFE